jgi:phage baseplate assembly protein W
MDLAFPFDFDTRGRTAAAAYDDHVRQMIEELVFTNPGERVNQPEFGSGLLQLVFAPNSPELAATVQFTLQAALQRWLGDVISVSDLTVTSSDASLTVEIDYVVLATGLASTATFTRPV